MTRAAILSLLERRREALDARDAEALVALHAPDGVVESLLAGTVRGRAAIAEVYRTWFTAFPDVCVQPQDLIVDENRAVQIATMSGTDMGSFLGLPATRKPFRLPIVFVYTFGEDCIAHERRLYDFTGLLVQIGALKTRLA